MHEGEVAYLRVQIARCDSEQALIEFTALGATEGMHPTQRSPFSIRVPIQDIKHLDGQFMTVLECAQAVRVSKMTIYRLIDKGRIPVTYVGEGRKMMRIHTSDWEDYLAGNG